MQLCGVPKNENLKNAKILKKIILPIAIVGILSFLFFPIFKGVSKNAVASASSSVKEIISSSNSYNAKVSSLAAAASTLYDSLHLSNMGLSIEALQYAYKGYVYLKEQGMLENEDILTVCDFSQSSKNKRMYIIDVANFKVLLNTYVAHGKNTGLDMAQNFSNKVESLQSSLGFYKTSQTYFGKHGLSLRLEGLEKGFNDKALERAVVVHGADYIGDHRKGGAYMGRSFGCPAVPQHQSKQVINTIKDGTVLFIYHPSKNYLNNSNILNS